MVFGFVGFGCVDIVWQVGQIGFVCDDQFIGVVFCQQVLVISDGQVGNLGVEFGEVCFVFVVQ